MKNYLLILLGFISLQSFAQTKPNLPDSEVEIVKNFKARLDEAQMLNVELPKPPVDTSRAFIRKYKLSEKPVVLEYPDPQMRPLSMPTEENPVENPLYLKLGYGVQNNPLASIAYGLTADRLRLQTNAQYESAKGLDNRNKKFRDIYVGAAAEYELTDLLLLSGDVSYINQNRGLYATEHNNDQSDSHFTYSVPAIHVGIKNAIPTAASFDYAADYTFRHTKDNVENKETYHLFTGSLRKAFSDDNIHVGLHGSAEFNTLKSIEKTSLNNYILGLNGDYHADQWYLKAGVDFAFLGDDIKLLPQAEIYANVKSLIRPYIGVRSLVMQNNFYHMTRDNPYLTREIDDLLNTVSMEFYGGVRGQAERGHFELNIGYKMAEDQVLFVNDFPDTTTFNPIYDDVNTFSIALKAEIIPIEDWVAGASLQINSYKPENEDEAWHLPGFVWNLYAGYNELLNKRLALKAQINSLSGLKYEDANGEAQKIKAQINFDILADYKINDRLDAFLHLNNLFNNKSDRYYGYDQIGINPQAGIRFRM